MLNAYVVTGSEYVLGHETGACMGMHPAVFSLREHCWLVEFKAGRFDR